MKRYFTDSDFLVGVFRQEDTNHAKAMKLLGEMGKEEVELWASNLVRQESATVVSHRAGMSAARLFVEKLAKDIQRWVKVDMELEGKAWGIFLKQDKKGTSFVDCANLAVIEKYKLDGILTFDGFYPKKMRVGG